jgi:hypothetical protein
MENLILKKCENCAFLFFYFVLQEIIFFHFKKRGKRFLDPMKNMNMDSYEINDN